MLEVKVIEKYNLRPKVGVVGVEIEVEGDNLPHGADLTPDFRKYWRVERDGSLRGQESLEYVFRTPVPLKKVSALLDLLTQAFEQFGSTVDDSVRAGIHVHVNVQKLTIKELCTMMTLYYVFENVLTHFCGEGRSGNHFCLRSSDAEYQNMALVEALQRNHWAQLGNDQIRYSSMNLNSLRKYGSLEFRAMRSTHDMDRVYLWCEILCQLKESSLKFDNPQDVIHAMSMGGDEGFNFLGDIFGTNAKVLITDHTRQDILEGMRHAQDIAFCIDWNE